ncbi:EamA-like transporter family protein [uncultured archaeon]|nr:EamA-like transporter family protein [uncultured archaeon]
MNILLPLISSLLVAISSFPLKKIMKTGEGFSVALIAEVFTLVFLLPLTNFSGFVFSFSWNLLIAVILWIIFSVTLMFSYNKVDASSRLIFFGIQPVLAVLFSALIVGEVISFNVIISMLFGAVACFFLFKGSDSGMFTKIGFILSLITSVVFALAGSFDKILSNQFGVFNYLAILSVCMIPILFVLAIALKKPVIKNLKKNFWRIIVYALLGVSVSSLNFNSYLINGVGITNLVLLSAIPIGIIIGYFVGEKDHMKEKIIASVLVILSVIILSV